MLLNNTSFLHVSENMVNLVKKYLYIGKESML